MLNLVTTDIAEKAEFCDKKKRSKMNICYLWSDVKTSVDHLIAKPWIHVYLQPIKTIMCISLKY